MAKTDVWGIAPWVPAGRPRAPARWWTVHGRLGPDALRVEDFHEGDAPPAVAAPCGLAAPCSLPREFLEFLGVARSRDVDGTLDRLLRQARAFAAAGKRGERHPRRVPHESMPSLDRRRLPLFHAALPLLRSAGAAQLVEVDVPAVLRALDLRHTDLAGHGIAAIHERGKILDALAKGAFGFRVEVPMRDFPVASLPALFAVVACAMAAWVVRCAPERPASGETWVPVP